MLYKLCLVSLAAFGFFLCYRTWLCYWAWRHHRDKPLDFVVITTRGAKVLFIPLLLVAAATFFHFQTSGNVLLERIHYVSILASVVLLIAYIKPRFFGLKFLLPLGIAMNGLVTFLNGNCMPTHISDSTIFPWLIDCIESPLIWTDSIVSIGDIFILIAIPVTVIQLGHLTIRGRLPNSSPPPA